MFQIDHSKSNVRKEEEGACLVMLKLLVLHLENKEKKQ